MSDWNGTHMDGMRFHRIAARLVLLAGLFALASCVTINIYFPAAAAEKAADQIIDDVLQLKEGGAAVNVKPAPGGVK